MNLLGRAGIGHTGPMEAGPTYEFQTFTLPRGTSRAAAHRYLTDAAEYGHWELARLRLRPDGTRQVWLRRRIIKAVRTA